MSISFTALGLSEVTVHHLEKLGFTTPTAIQSEALPHLLSGRDVVGQAQTGTGKTAAFSLPILERIDPHTPAVQALILTPTRELAMQVYQAIVSFNVHERLRVLPVYGGQAIEPQIQKLHRGVHIVVGTPGRVLDLLSRGSLKLNQLSCLVLDEADEMLNMGFIEDVETILSHAPAERQTAFFSATMAPPIRELATKFLRSPITVTIEQPKATPTQIDQVAYMIPRGWSKSRALQPILELIDPESALIFVRTRKSAAELTSQLQAAGYSVDEYHGNLTQSQREKLLLRFRQRQVRWVVATDVAARGLHVDHLTHVINYDLPDSTENFVHRTGRTGRAGKTGTAISLIHPLDRRKLRDIERHIRQSLEVRSVPTRAQIEVHRLEKLENELRNALAGERMASFLPIVAKLAEEFESNMLAAAALQMAHDYSRPAWIQSNVEVFDGEEDHKVVIKSGRRHERGDRHEGEDRGRPKPKPVKRSNLQAHAGRE